PGPRLQRRSFTFKVSGFKFAEPNLKPETWNLKLVCYDETTSRQMALLSDRGPRVVRCGDGLQRVSDDRGAGEPRPISLRFEAGYLDAHRVRSDVRDDAARLSALESRLDRLWLAAADHCALGCGLRVSASERRAPLDQIEWFFCATVRGGPTLPPNLCGPPDPKTPW